MLSAARDIRDAWSSYFVMDEVAYQVVTNLEAAANADNLHDSLEIAIARLGRGCPARPDLRARLDELKTKHTDPARFPQSGIDDEPGHNLIRQTVDTRCKRVAITC